MQASAEVAELGLDAPVPAGMTARLDGLAAVFAGQVAAGYAQATSRKAVLLAADAGEAELNAAIRTHLDDIGTSRSGLVADTVGAALTSAQNTGRASVLSQLTDVVWVADERLDHATCGPCKDADGVVYDTWAQAEAHYPVIGNAACLGGGRCRGLLRAKPIT
jgi:hypothetical protein